MKLTIKNVAKVKLAEIELNGISSIAGYNGTGKSTISKMLYGILDTFSNLDKRIIQERAKSIVASFYEIKDSKGTVNHTNYENINIMEKAVRNWLNQMYRKEDSFDSFYKNFPMFYKNIIRSSYLYKNDNPEDLTDNFDYQKLYNVFIDNFNRPDDNYIKFILEINLRNIFDDQINDMRNKNSEADIHLDFGNDSHIHFIILNNRISIIDLYRPIIPSPIYIEPRNVLDNFFLGRMGRNRKYGEINLANSLREMSALEKNTDISLEEYEEREANIKIIQEIFSKVIHGKLVTQSNFYYLEDDLDENISLNNVASGLKNFLIIQSLIQNGTLVKNSTLIIDEPEVNLHPDWQLKFAEVLVLIRKSFNINILLNTHSPYFLRAIEHYMGAYCLADYGKYYKTKEENNYFSLIDVTNNTNLVYEDLYAPFEKL